MSNPHETFINHIRYFDDFGQLLPNGGVTVVWRYNPEDQEFQAGVSICHKRDAYNKKVGVRLATERLENGDYIYSEHDEILDFLTTTLTPTILKPGTPVEIDFSTLSKFFWQSFIGAKLDEWIELERNSGLEAE